MLNKLLRSLSRPEPQAAAPLEPRFRHSDSWPASGEAAFDRLGDTPYLKTYDFPGEDIDASHRRLGAGPARDGAIDLGPEGGLAPADARKLYELAYFCGGDILELGALHGLSTSILALASAAAGLRNAVTSVHATPDAIAGGRTALKGRPGAERVAFMQADGNAALDRLARARRLFRLAFVDHAHRYELVLGACERLPRVMAPGGFVLLHGYGDGQDPATEAAGDGVRQGVRDGLDQARFELWGVHGCCGLFRRRRA